MNLRVCGDVNKKYVKKEVVTITRTQEFSIVEDATEDVPISNTQFVSVIWRLIKKYIFADKWMGGKEDG
jgi:hypothetical protein